MKNLKNLMVALPVALLVIACGPESNADQASVKTSANTTSTTTTIDAGDVDAYTTSEKAEGIQGTTKEYTQDDVDVDVDAENNTASATVTSEGKTTETSETVTIDAGEFDVNTTTEQADGIQDMNSELTKEDVEVRDIEPASGDAEYEVEVESKKNTQ